MFENDEFGEEGGTPAPAPEQEVQALSSQGEVALIRSMQAALAVSPDPEDITKIESLGTINEINSKDALKLMQAIISKYTPTDIY